MAALEYASTGRQDFHNTGLGPRGISEARLIWEVGCHVVTRAGLCSTDRQSTCCSQPHRCLTQFSRDRHLNKSGYPEKEICILGGPMMNQEAQFLYLSNTCIYLMFMTTNSAFTEKLEGEVETKNCAVKLDKKMACV
jgi:hypothetical protein